MSARAFTFLVNPLSGGGAGPGTAQPVAERLRAAGAAVEVCEATSVEVGSAALQAGLARGDIVVAVGGDGMVSSVAGPVARAGGTLAVLQAGRGNDFARMLELPSERDEQVRMLLEGAESPVDLLSVQFGPSPARLVAGSVYSGVDAIASEIVDRVRWMPTRLQYPWAAVHALATYKPMTASVVIDGTHREFTAATVVVANSGYYGSGMHIAPSAVVDDGVLEVVVIEAASRRGLIKALPTIYDGSHVERPEVHVLRGRVVELSGTPSVPMGGDGEPLGALPELGATPARIEVLPGALRLIRP